MKPLRLIKSSVFIVMISLSGATGQNRGLMGNGLDLIRAGDTCLLLGGDTRSDPFVQKVRVRKKHGKPNYFVGSTKISTFPDTITVTVRTVVHRCGPEEKGKQQNHMAIDEQFVQSLQFRAYWLNGLESRKADIALVKQGPDLESSGSTGEEWWQYVLAVNSKDIPVTDALSILVLDRQGMVISRLGGRL